MGCTHCDIAAVECVKVQSSTRQWWGAELYLGQSTQKSLVLQLELSAD